MVLEVEIILYPAKKICVVVTSDNSYSIGTQESTSGEQLKKGGEYASINTNNRSVRCTVVWCADSAFPVILLYGRWLRKLHQRHRVFE